MHEMKTSTRLEALQSDSERQRSQYLIQCAAGSCRSWGLRRQDERLWDSPAATLRHPRQSGALSHTSPGICRREREGEKCGELRPAQCRERPLARAQLLSEAWASEVLIARRASRFSDVWRSSSHLTGLGHSFTGGNTLYSESRKSTSLSVEYTMCLAWLLLKGRDSCRKVITEAVSRSRTASKCTSPDYTLVTYTMLYVRKCDEPLQITTSKMWNWVTRKHKNSPFPPRGQQLVSDWKTRASLLAKRLIIRGYYDQTENHIIGYLKKKKKTTEQAQLIGCNHNAAQRADLF